MKVYNLEEFLKLPDNIVFTRWDRDGLKGLCIKKLPIHEGELFSYRNLNEYLTNSWDEVPDVESEIFDEVEQYGVSKAVELEATFSGYRGGTTGYNKHKSSNDHMFAVFDVVEVLAMAADLKKTTGF